MMTLNHSILVRLWNPQERSGITSYKLGAPICSYPNHSNSNGAVCLKARRVEGKRVHSDPAGQPQGNFPTDPNLTCPGSQ